MAANKNGKKDDKKDEIKVVSKLKREFDSDVEIAGKKYLVITESERPFITSRVYDGGEIISTYKTDYLDILKAPDLDRRLYELMEFQHRRALNSLKAEKLREAKTPSDYISEVKGLMRRRGHKDALGVLSEGLEQHPGDPFLLSYKGCLEAVVNKNYSQGIGLCRDAMKALKERLPFGSEFFYPVFYLNLGRAYLASGRKRDAVVAFRKGLAADKDNADILWEMGRLGLRKSPPIPFLKRSNPLNKYIGMLLHRLR